jgi:hypothetical protein
MGTGCVFDQKPQIMADVWAWSRASQKRQYGENGRISVAKQAAQRRVHGRYLYLAGLSCLSLQTRLFTMGLAEADKASLDDRRNPGERGKKLGQYPWLSLN